MFINSPDHIEMRSILLLGVRDWVARGVHIVFEGVGEYKMPRDQVILAAEVKVVSHNYLMGFRTYRVNLLPHKSVKVGPPFEDYLKECVKDVADEVLDIHACMESLI